MRSCQIFLLACLLLCAVVDGFQWNLSDWASLQVRGGCMRATEAAGQQPPPYPEQFYKDRKCPLILATLRTFNTPAGQPPLPDDCPVFAFHNWFAVPLCRMLSFARAGDPVFASLGKAPGLILQSRAVHLGKKRSMLGLVVFETITVWRERADMAAWFEGSGSHRAAMARWKGCKGMLYGSRRVFVPASELPLRGSGTSNREFVGRVKSDKYEDVSKRRPGGVPAVVTGRESRTQAAA